PPPDWPPHTAAGPFMALVTLSALQAVTGITDDAARLSALIPIAASRMARFRGVESLEAADYTELPDGERSSPVVLRHGTGIAVDAARSSAVIPLAGSRMARFVGVESFEAADYTELHGGEGSSSVVLRNVPVTAVASVALTDGTTDTVLDADSYTFDPES